jgi:teichuronic acid biosynthesis glycosyltransferase TuaH
MEVISNESTNEIHLGDNELKGRCIVIISLQPWYYEIGSNCKNLAVHFAKNNRVLYVNAPVTRKTFLSNLKNPGLSRHCTIISQKAEPIKPIRENMWELYPTTLIESINWLPSTFIFKQLNFLNNKRFAKNISRAVEMLGFKDIILFNDNDIYNGFHLKELIKPKLYAYYMRDFLQGYSFWKKFSKILEPELIRKADVVVANSQYYADYAKSYNSQSFYVGQGCNLDIFKDKSGEIPPDLSHIRKPIIGYVGALDSARLSIDVIKLIATTRPDWNVVLVGPEDTNFIASDLHRLSNIHFLGRRDISQLPLFVQAFDVCINPQLVNVITNGNYPLKIDEYLAMGKQVVATKTKAMELFSDYTYLAQEPADYPGLIEKALDERDNIDKPRLIKFACSHTWENSANHIYQAFMLTEQ